MVSFINYIHPVVFAFSPALPQYLIPFHMWFLVLIFIQVRVLIVQKVKLGYYVLPIFLDLVLVHVLRDVYGGVRALIH